MKNELSKHYEMLLGLDANWLVENVRLEMEQKRVEIRLKHSGKSLICPECKKPCARHDYAEERSWRHLDTMQFETRVIARIPRANCSECGVKTTEVPWAGKHSRFTLMFEAFAIHVLGLHTQCVQDGGGDIHLRRRGGIKFYIRKDNSWDELGVHKMVSPPLFRVLHKNIGA